MRRGEIWWASLGVPYGSEPGLRRPVVILQADEFNRSAIQTVIVVPLTSNLRLAAAPGNVLCRGRDTRLRRSSVANVSQLTVIDRRRLTERVGSISDRLLRQVEEGVRLVLAL
jgi:mRNA interferase MazF